MSHQLSVSANGPKCMLAQIESSSASKWRGHSGPRRVRTDPVKLAMLSTLTLSSLGNVLIHTQHDTFAIN